MFNHTCTVDTDLLVLGGGSAGAMAAIWAREVDPSQRVTVFEKGDIKYSGCIARGMDALNVVAVPGVATPGDYIKSMHIACEGVIDDSPSLAMVSRTWDLVRTLSSWGIYFPQDEQGNYEVLQTHAVGRFNLTMHEPELKTKLAARLHDKGATVFNRVMAVELLVEEGRVVGAIGLNVRTGEIVVCRAKAVILTSGGAARFGLPGSGYLYGVFDFPGNSGDGYMLAYRAGAQLTGFEHTMSYCIIKDVDIPLIYIVVTRGAKVLDAVDRDMTGAKPIMPSMLHRHAEGFGPMRIRLRDLSEERIEEIEKILFTVERPVQKRFHAARGVDFRREDIELWPTDYYLCGGHGNTGVVVNDRAETSVPGLYCAGDTACVARGYLSGAFTFGQIAAENATAYAGSIPMPRVDYDQERAFQRKRDRLLQCRGRVGVDEYEFKVRRIITDYALPPKNALKLEMARDWMDRLGRDLEQWVMVRNTRDLFKLLEIENIIGCAAVSATASAERKESRWGDFHYRTDYPQRDDANWLKHVICQRGAGDMDVQISHRAVERREVPEWAQ